MNIKTFIPGPAEITREALIVIVGALFAAAVIGQMPGVRNWIKAQWDGAQSGNS